MKKDLNGLKFNKLTIIQENGSNRYGRTWLCRCDCGKEKTILTTHIINNKVKSCGCLIKEKKEPRPENLIGNKYGRLTVVKLDGFKYNKLGIRVFYWFCQCDCGGTKIVSSRSLKGEKTKSCGCFILENRVKKYNNIDVIENQIYMEYINNAKKNKREFTLSCEDVKIILQSNCYYCNNEPCNLRRSKNKNKSNYKYNGIDRIDNDLGYTKINTVPCCKDCNFMKHTMNKDKFLEIIKRIYNFRIKKVEDQHE